MNVLLVGSSTRHVKTRLENAQKTAKNGGLITEKTHIKTCSLFRDSSNVYKQRM